MHYLWPRHKKGKDGFVSYNKQAVMFSVTSESYRRATLCKRSSGGTI